jgi:hypothetical protein
MKKKLTWGGKRVSTKPKKEATKVMRIPISKVKAVQKLIHGTKEYSPKLKIRAKI